MANTGIHDIIVGKLRYKQKLCLIILLKVDKDLEIGFYCIILPLSLAICLWVEDDGESLFDVKKVA